MWCVILLLFLFDVASNIDVKYKWTLKMTSVRWSHSNAGWYFMDFNLMYQRHVLYLHIVFDWRIFNENTCQSSKKLRFIWFSATILPDGMPKGNASATIATKVTYFALPDWQWIRFWWYLKANCDVTCSVNHKNNQCWI